MSVRSIANRIKIGAAFALAIGASAQAQTATIWDNFGVNNNRFGWYVDFAATTIAGHFAEPTGVIGGGAAVKYHFFRLITQGTADAGCWDISTQHPDFIPAATADTRIWYRNQAGNDQVLNDDFGGTTFSHGKAYLVGQNALIDFKIAAYSSAHNTAHFKVYVTRTNATEAACTTGNGGTPWVKWKNGVITNG